MLSEWSEWQRCERMCGQENIERSRNFLNNEEECREKFPDQHARNVEKKDCGNPPCPDDKFVRRLISFLKIMRSSSLNNVFLLSEMRRRRLYELDRVDRVLERGTSVSSSNLQGRMKTMKITIND